MPSTPYEALADDATPGEWIVLDTTEDPAKPGPTTLARFYGHDAELDARDHARRLNELAGHIEPITDSGLLIGFLVVLSCLGLIALAVGTVKSHWGW